MQHMTDLQKAETFIWSNARLLDRHRFVHEFKGGPREPVLAALAPYQNPDGGYGNGLERGPGLSSSTWRLYRSLNDILDPGPSMSIVFSDQREDQNGLPSLGFDMTGYPDRPELTQFTDELLPFYHGNSTSYSFADGHSELKRWKDPRSLVPVWKQRNQWIGFIRQPNNPDIRWLQERATRKNKNPG